MPGVAQSETLSTCHMKPSIEMRSGSWPGARHRRATTVKTSRRSLADLPSGRRFSAVPDSDHEGTFHFLAGARTAVGMEVFGLDFERGVVN